MKLIVAALLACATGCMASDPGPPLGHKIDRTYDDGYVLVDSTGNSFDLTWNWGYVDASQYFAASDTYHFHTIQITGAVATVLTDIYSAAGVVVPAPYSGSFPGPGPTLPDEPISRSVETFSIPILATSRSVTNVVLMSLGSTNVLLETTAGLGTNPLATVWTKTTNAPVVTPNQALFLLSPTATQNFYRVKLVLP